MKEMPSSYEIEEAILGALIMDPPLQDHILTEILTEDFYTPFTRSIFESILSLKETRKSIDFSTVMDASGVGVDDMVRICQNFLSASIPTYIRTLKGKTVRRKYVQAAKDIYSLAIGKDYPDEVELKSAILSKVDIQCYHENRLQTMPDIAERVLSNIEKRMNNEDSMLKYGLPWLDKKTGGLWPGEVVIVAARPSIGKSSFASHVAIFNAFRKFRILFFNMEMSIDNMAERVLSNMSGVSGDHFKTPKLMPSEMWKRIGVSASDMAKLPVTLIDDIYTIEAVTMRAKSIKASKGLDCIIIDYLQQMDTRKRTNSTNEKVSLMSRACKIMAKDLNIPVMVLSQLSRSGDKKEPSLTDLRDSGAIEQDADTVLFLHDPKAGNYKDGEESNEADIDIIVAKQRNGRRDMKHSFRYIKTNQRWQEVIYGYDQSKNVGQGLPSEPGKDVANDSQG